MIILGFSKSIKARLHGNLQEECNLLLKKLIISIYELDECYRDECTSIKYILSYRLLLPGDWLEETNRRINNSITFVIRSSTMMHNRPHFKVIIRGKGAGLYSLETLQPIQTSIEKGDEEELLAWAREHRSDMLDVWNMFTGNRIIVE